MPSPEPGGHPTPQLPEARPTRLTCWGFFSGNTRSWGLLAWHLRARSGGSGAQLSPIKSNRINMPVPTGMKHGGGRKASVGAPVVRSCCQLGPLPGLPLSLCPSTPLRAWTLHALPPGSPDARLHLRRGGHSLGSLLGRVLSEAAQPGSLSSRRPSSWCQTGPEQVPILSPSQTP